MSCSEGGKEVVRRGPARLRGKSGEEVTREGGKRMSQAEILFTEVMKGGLEKSS